MSAQTNPLAWMGENAEAPVEIVQLSTRHPEDPRPRRFFLADERAVWSHEDGPLQPPWVCVHSVSTSPTNVVRMLNYHAGRRPGLFDRYRFWIFEADRKTDAVNWLRERGFATESTPYYSDPHYTEKMEKHHMKGYDRLAQQRESAERQLRRAQERLDFLDSLPAEPEPDEDGTAVVWFQKTFNRGGQVYTYSAVLASNGSWYTTGPEGGGTPRTWEELVLWITSNNDYPTIYVATEWAELG